jgi:hypothetical protein
MFHDVQVISNLFFGELKACKIRSSTKIDLLLELAPFTMLPSDIPFSLTTVNSPLFLRLFMKQKGRGCRSRDLLYILKIIIMV